MIDIHSHLLPGVDDGSPSVDVTLPVLERFAADGVTVLVLTPHLQASDAERVTRETYADVFAELIARAPAQPELRRGWEIMLDGPGYDLTAAHLRLDGSSAVLVEFPRTGLPRGSTDELARLARSGLVPVVAHPERYWGCTPEIVRQWRGVGAAMQLDAAMLVGRGPVAQLGHAILAQGLADCIASDNHGDRRTLGAARRWLEEMGMTEEAHLLTEVNPGRLLAGERPIPVPPITTLERSAFGRLRELIFGRR